MSEYTRRVNLDTWKDVAADVPVVPDEWTMTTTSKPVPCISSMLLYELLRRRQPLRCACEYPMQVTLQKGQRHSGLNDRKLWVVRCPKWGDGRCPLWGTALMPVGWTKDEIKK